MKNFRTLIGISVFWLALGMLTDGINSLVLPALILEMSSEGTQATTLGLLTFAGLMAAMLIQPLAGAFSDRMRPRWGRRGTIAGGLILVLLSLTLFGSDSSLPVVILGYIGMQIAGSIAQAAQQGYIPDQIPVRQRGTASGIKSLMDIGGAMIGFLLLGQILRNGQTGAALGALATFLIATFLVAVFLVREPVNPLPPAAVALLRRPGAWMIGSAYKVDSSRQRGFFWLVFSRFLFLLATFAIGRFLLFFVADRMGMEAGQAAEEAGFLLACLAFIGVVAAVPAGRAADRFGRIPLMAFGAIASAAGVILLIYARTSIDILVFGSLMSIGSAAFSAANWAMTADMVPSGEAARHFGLANFGTAGAAAAAGLFGPLVDAVNTISPGTGFTALFVAAAVVFLASGIAVRGARHVIGQSETVSNPS